MIIISTICAFECMCTYLCGCPWRLKRVTDPLKLEGCWDPNFGPHDRRTTTFNTRACRQPANVLRLDLTVLVALTTNSCYSSSASAAQIPDCNILLRIQVILSVKLKVVFFSFFLSLSPSLPPSLPPPFLPSSLPSFYFFLLRQGFTI